MGSFLVRDSGTGRVAERLTLSTSDGSSGQNISTGQIVFPAIANGQEDTTVTTTISATWAATGMLIEATLNPDVTGSDHTLEEALMERLTLRVISVVDGVSVDVLGYAPNGSSGSYNIQVIGFK